MHITVVITFYVLLGHNKKRYKICLGSGRLLSFLLVMLYSLSPNAPHYFTIEIRLPV
jgi:hypothetical protein